MWNHKEQVSKFTQAQTKVIPFCDQSLHKQIGQNLHASSSPTTLPIAPGADRLSQCHGMCSRPHSPACSSRVSSAHLVPAVHHPCPPHLLILGQVKGCVLPGVGPVPRPHHHPGVQGWNLSRILLLSSLPTSPSLVSELSSTQASLCVVSSDFASWPQDLLSLCMSGCRDLSALGCKWLQDGFLVPFPLWLHPTASSDRAQGLCQGQLCTLLCLLKVWQIYWFERYGNKGKEIFLQLVLVVQLLTQSPARLGSPFTYLFVVIVWLG